MQLMDATTLGSSTPNPTPPHARFALGVAGNVTAFGLLVSSLSTFYDIYKVGTVGNRSCVAYISILLNSICWVLYCLTSPRANALILTINSIGAGMELGYIALFLVYSSGKKKVGAAIMLAGVVIFTAILLPLDVVYVVHRRDWGRRWLGIFAAVTGALMYIAPVLDAIKVIQTKDIKIMSEMLALASLLNDIVWMAYGLVGGTNYFVLIPNVIGLACAAMQLMVYVKYRWITPPQEGGAAAPHQGGAAAPNQGVEGEAAAAPNQGGEGEPTAPNQGGEEEAAAPNQGGEEEAAAPNLGGERGGAAPNQQREGGGAAPAAPA